ncbi:hypothetical protein NQ315_012891 [Exocentrus adspersus]|uniref:Uncharacterized protein n=1 Tax=Exocentrus adspersus TaxID=1586481 RepID=A0AAV8VGA7_9CUCU|nr:hypothetical protein NQ315_012891 [Exocentrus adspersus]
MIKRTHIILLGLVAAVSTALPPLKPFQPSQRQQLKSFLPSSFSSVGRTQTARSSQATSFQRPGLPYKIRYVTSKEDGQYRSENSGSVYSGDGQYSHDDSGTYVHDNSGAYVHQDVPYVHLDVPYEHQEIGGGEYVHPVYVESIPPAGGYGPPVTLKKGNAAGLYDNRNYKIIRKIEHVGEDLYDYLYQTENGIYAEEDGKIANKGNREEAIRAKGYFTYTGPDSNIYTVNYTADENGFLPEADHIPTPPPLPEAIARSLAYQRAIGELTDRR